MKIELAKIPVKVGEETAEKDYVLIQVDDKTLSLPLDPNYSTDEYKRVFQGFFTSINDVVVETKEKKEDNG